jgi:hypothetical protein
LFRVHPATPENLDPLVRAFIEAGKDWTRSASLPPKGFKCSPLEGTDWQVLVPACTARTVDEYLMKSDQC